MLEHLQDYLAPAQYAELLTMAKKEDISVYEIIAEAISFYLANADNSDTYDLEDVTDSIKEAFTDIHKGNTRPIEELLNELSTTPPDFQ